jgi:hypothetical protein
MFSMLVVTESIHIHDIVYQVVAIFVPILQFCLDILRVCHCYDTQQELNADIHSQCSPYTYFEIVHITIEL